MLQIFSANNSILQQTNICAKVFPETLRITTNSSKQTSILYQNFSQHYQSPFCSKRVFSVKIFPNINNSILLQTIAFCQTFPINKSIFAAKEYSLPKLFLKNREFPPTISLLLTKLNLDRCDGVEVRAFASQSVDLGFIPLVESYQKTLKNGIRSFPAWRSAFRGGCGEKAGKFACCVLGQGT